MLSGYRSFAAMILEEDEELGGWPGMGMALEETGISGWGGSGKGKKTGVGNRKGKGGEDMTKMREYYERMIKSNPGDSLLLRNYGQFLHEVEGDVERAEECYGKAILASPGDGEALSLYGKLIWDSHRDGREPSHISTKPFWLPPTTAPCWVPMHISCGRQGRRRT